MLTSLIEIHVGDVREWMKQNQLVFLYLAPQVALFHQTLSVVFVCMDS